MQQLSARTRGRARLLILSAFLVLAAVAALLSQHHATEPTHRMEVTGVTGAGSTFEVDFTTGCSAHGEIRSATIRSFSISAGPRTEAPPMASGPAPQPTTEAERQALIVKKAAAAARDAATRPYALTGSIFAYKGPGTYSVTGPSMSTDTALRLTGPNGLELMASGGTITVTSDTASGAMGHLEAAFTNRIAAKGAWGCTGYLD